MFRHTAHMTPSIDHLEKLNLADTIPCEQLTIPLIRSKLTPKELRWFDLEVAYCGEVHVLRCWRNYESQLNYVREL